MSEPLMKAIVDCSTGEVSMVPLTPEEIAAAEQRTEEYLALKAAEDAAKAAADAAKASGIAKLLALGLTEEEANALVK